MVRIAGVNIPSEKRLVISLTYVHGIGNTLAKKICSDSQISENIKVKNLTDDNLISLRRVIENNFLVEGDLRREVQLNIKKKKDIKSYQGVAHIRGMPVRGQNTKSNAKTRKRKMASRK